MGATSPPSQDPSTTTSTPAFSGIASLVLAVLVVAAITTLCALGKVTSDAALGVLGAVVGGHLVVGASNIVSSR